MKTKKKLIFWSAILSCTMIVGVAVAVPPPIFQIQQDPPEPQVYEIPQYQELYYPPITPEGEHSEPTASNSEEEETDHGASFLELLQDLEQQKPSLPKISHEGVVLKGLDKITARTSMLDLKIDQQGVFNSLVIKTRACQKNSPEEKPETAAYLEIDEKRPNGTIERVFSGWMLASSPAISALDHPIYDIWVVDCKTSSTTSDASVTTPESSEESGKN